MIRLAVFAVLGPLAGYFVFIGLGGGFKGDYAGPAFAMLLPVAWIAGLLPALLTAAFDRLVERLGARSFQRYVLTGIAGYAAAYMLMLANYFEVETLIPFRYDWGLIGGIPALLCSLATEKLEIPVNGQILRR
jgi:hypothetical protein